MSGKSSPSTRPSLILRLRDRRDLQAWQDFVELYEPVIQGLAEQRGLQLADADDVTQEILTRVARSIETWDPDPARGSFRSWLATITRNVVIQSFREASRRPSVGIPEETPSSIDEEFDREHERQLFAWAARKIQTKYQPQTWQAFWLTAVDGRPVPEVARLVEMTCAQVYVARSRVMKLLRQTIEHSQFDPHADGNVT